MDRIIECVPNYSEGRNKEIIDQIVAAVADTKVVTERGEESVKCWTSIRAKLPTGLW